MLGKAQMSDEEIFQKLEGIVNARNQAFRDAGVQCFIYKDQISCNHLKIIAPKMQWDEFEKFCDQYHKDENSKIQKVLENLSYYKDNNRSDYGIEYAADYFLREIKRTNNPEKLSTI